MKILFLSPNQAQNTSLTTLAVFGLKPEGARRRFFEGRWVPRSWWQFMVRGLEHLKQGQYLRSPLFTKRPERQQEGWRRVGAQRLLSRPSEELEEEPVSSALPDGLSTHWTLTRHWQSSCSKSSVGLLLWAQMPEVLCLWW